MDTISASSSASAARLIQSLDGVWEVRHESEPGWREARVPAPWQHLDGLGWSFGRAIYRRRFALPAAAWGRELALHFGAVSEVATVRVNGRELGRHEGGYL